MDDDLTLWGLFLSAFLSSTLLPGGSELVLVGLILAQMHSISTLLAVATLGNTLGGLTSYGIGRVIALRYPARGLAKPAQQQAAMRVQRWGSPVLLLSWLPVVGDPLCMAAGWLKMNWLACALFIAIGKAARYGVILAAL